jgi:hypothetical protein
MSSENVIEFLVSGKDGGGVAALNGVEQALAGLEKVVGLVGLAMAAVKFIEFIDHAIESADAVGKLSQKTGVATESLSQMTHAFMLADVTTDQLGTAFKFLNKNIAEAAGGSKTAVAQFAALGLSMADLKALSPEQVLLRVADAFAKSKDDANKSAVAMQLFGRSGVEMIPGLNQGREGIERLMQQADKLGLTVDQGFAEQSEHFKDSMKTINAASAGVANSLAKTLIPTLNATVDGIIDLASTGDESVIPWGKILQLTAALVGIAFITLIAGVKVLYSQVSGAFNALGLIIGAFGAAVAAVASGEFTEAGQIIKEGFIDAGNAVEKSFDSANKVLVKSDEEIAKIWASLDSAKTKIDEVGAAKERAGKKSLTFIDPAAFAELEKLQKKQVEYFNNLDRMIAESHGYKLGVIDAEKQKQLNALQELKLGAQQDADARLKIDEWYAGEKQKLTAGMLQSIGALSTTYHQFQQQQVEDELKQLRTMGASAVEIELYKSQRLTEIALNDYNQRKQLRDQELQGIITFSNSVTEVVSTSTAQWANSVQTWQEQVAEATKSVFTGVVQGVGNAVAQSIIYNKNLGEALKDVLKQVAASLISALVQIGIQRLILAGLFKTTVLTESASAMASGLAEVYVNSFASTAAIPIVGPELAPAVAAGATAAAAAGAEASGTAGAALGSTIAGVAHGGLNSVPSESTFLLNKGERVLSPEQNQDLTGFLNSSDGSGGMRIENLTIHVLENATNFSALMNMDVRAIRDLVAAKFIPAMNLLDKQGIRPVFVERYSR